MNNDYVKEVADQLIEHLQKGTAPFQKRWKAGELVLPYNPTTETQYHGVNMLKLAMESYDDPRWMTLKQANELGAKVRKGQHSTRIMYWKATEERLVVDEQGKPVLDEEGKQKKETVKLERPRAFFARVFNANQIDGLPPLSQQTPKIPEPEEINKRCEKVIKNSGATIFNDQRDSAYYDPMSDEIHLPHRDQFHSPAHYYSTTFHEMSHWTGHKTRLNREIGKAFGSEPYAREELRAEIGSLMVGQQLNIGFEPKDNAAYVNSWCAVLKKDPREIFRAASDASKIADYLIDFENEKELTKEQPVKAAEAEIKAETVENTAEAETKMENKEPKEKLFINVPYTERYAAKRAGARWDKEAKSWYVAAGTDLKKIGLERFEKKVEPTIDPHDEFLNDARAAGLIINDPQFDGKLHRVPVEGDKGRQLSGAYVYFSEQQHPGGFLQNFKTGYAENWKSSQVQERLSPAEIETMRKEAAERSEQLRLETEKRHEATAEIARAVFAEAVPAKAENDYLAKKGISPAGLMVVPDQFSKELEETGVHVVKNAAEYPAMAKQHPNDQIFVAGRLIIPAFGNDGKIQTLQTIDAEQKTFMRGGKKYGSYSLVGAQNLDQLDPKKPVIVAEGFATAVAVNKVTNSPVIVAFDAGNMKPVGETLRDKFPHQTIIFAADNDLGRKTNVGLTKAQDAAATVGGAVVTPNFDRDEINNKMSDWDDYLRKHGHDETTKLFQAKLAIASNEAKAAQERLNTLAQTKEAYARDDHTTEADNQYIGDERLEAQQIRTQAMQTKNSAQSVEQAKNTISRENQNLSQSKEERMAQKPTTQQYRAKKKAKNKEEGIEL